MNQAKEKLLFWRKKLREYQKKYDELRQQSPERWWHDEFFDNQMRVWENSISAAKERIEELREKLK